MRGDAAPRSLGLTAARQALANADAAGRAGDGLRPHQLLRMHMEHCSRSSYWIQAAYGSHQITGRVVAPPSYPSREAPTCDTSLFLFFFFFRGGNQSGGPPLPVALGVQALRVLQDVPQVHEVLQAQEVEEVKVEQEERRAWQEEREK